MIVSFRSLASTEMDLAVPGQIASPALLIRHSLLSVVIDT